MKKLLIILTMLLSVSMANAKIYYYESLEGLVDATDGGTFCDVEEGTCTYDESVDVRIEFDKTYIYADLGVETVLSYNLIGDDRDSAILSVSTNDTLFLDADDITLDTTAKTITIPGELLDTAGEVRITLTAQNSNGDIQAQDYAYVSVATINSNNMLTRWTVSAGETVQFPFSTDFSNTYDGHVDWGDDSGIETFENVTIQSLTHTYIEAGTYEIRIDGGFANEDNFYNMFLDSTIPSGMDISSWDVSNVRGLVLTFYGTTFPSNFDISDWDISNVTNLRTTFMNALLPSNLDLKLWDISNVNSLGGTFKGTTISSNFDISGWDISKVSHTSESFKFNSIEGDFIYNKTVSEILYSKFLQILANPNTGFPESTTGQSIIAGDNACAEEDNECILARKALIAKGWVVEDATVDTDLVIDEDTALESRWTVSAGETVQFPVYYSYSGIIDWGDDSAVEEFDDLKSLTHTYEEAGTYTTLMNGSWGSSLGYMFREQTIPSNLDISSWDISNINSLAGMFVSATIPERFNINSWNVSNIENMQSLFYGVNLPNDFDISSWNVSNIINIGALFNQTTIPSNLDLSSWDVSNVYLASAMFFKASIFGNLNLSGWNLSNAEINVSSFMLAATHISGNIIYDKTVSRTVYSDFIQIITKDSEVYPFPDSMTSQKIYVGDNKCSLGDTDCETAETTLTNKGWVITRTTAN